MATDIALTMAIILLEAIVIIGLLVWGINDGPLLRDWEG